MITQREVFEAVLMALIVFKIGAALLDALAETVMFGVWSTVLWVRRRSNNQKPRERHA